MDERIEISKATWDGVVKALEDMVEAYDDPEDRPSMVVSALAAIENAKKEVP